MSQQYSRVKSFLPLLALILSFAFLADSNGEVRTWQDKSGNFSVDADYVRISGDSVTLRREDGTEVNVPLAKLSDTDTRYIERREQGATSSEKSASSELEKDTDTDTGTKTDTEAESQPEEGFINGFWHGFQISFEGQIDDEESAEEMADSIEGLKMIGSFVPDDKKALSTAPIMLILGILMSPIIFIWLLVAEFKTHVGWGIAQLVTFVVGFCFLPLLGALVTVAFILSNLKEQWLLGLAHVICIVLMIGAFAFIPDEVYDGIDLTPPPVETEAEAESA